MFDNRWDNWAGDFAESFAASTFEPATRERVAEILHHFGAMVRRLDPDFPDSVAPKTFATVFAEHLSRLNLSSPVRADVPEVVARFFEYLQEGGRLGEGFVWAEQIRTLEVTSTPTKAVRAPERGTTIRKGAGAGVGRNDPCPCGSGKKYKKCCST